MELSELANKPFNPKRISDDEFSDLAGQFAKILNEHPENAHDLLGVFSKLMQIDSSYLIDHKIKIPLFMKMAKEISFKEEDADDVSLLNFCSLGLALIPSKSDMKHIFATKKNASRLFFKATQQLEHKYTKSTNLTNVLIAADEKDCLWMWQQLDIKDLSNSDLAELYSYKPILRSFIWDIIKSSNLPEREMSSYYNVIHAIVDIDPSKALDCLQLVSEAIGFKTKEDIYKNVKNNEEEIFRALGNIRKNINDKDKVDEIIKYILAHITMDNRLVSYAKCLLGEEDELASRIKIGQKVRKEDADFGFKYVNSIDTDSPALIVFGGNGAQKEEASNGYLSVIKRLLKRHHLDKNVKLYSVVYNFGKSLYERETANNCYVKEIFDKVFLPRISDENGQRLSLSEACNKIRKINVITHCHGSKVFSQLEKIMQNKLQEIGYSKKESAQIQHELFCVAFTPLEGFRGAKSTTISFSSVDEDRFLKFSPDYAPSGFRKWMKYEAQQNGFSFGYFPKGRGNLILASSLGEKIDSHNFLGYSPATIGLNFNGRIWTLMSENAIVNGIKNSMSGAMLPSVEDLICGDNIFLRKFLKKIKQNGDIAWSKIKSYITDENKCKLILSTKDDGKKY